MQMILINQSACPRHFSNTCGRICLNPRLLGPLVLRNILRICGHTGAPRCWLKLHIRELARLQTSLTVALFYVQSDGPWGTQRLIVCCMVRQRVLQRLLPRHHGFAAGHFAVARSSTES